MSKLQKGGYVALCIISLFNFIGDIYITIAGTHIGMNADGFLRKFSKFILSLDGFCMLFFICLPMVISLVISIIIFMAYRKKLSKSTAVLASLGFLPYLMFYLFGYILGAIGLLVMGVLKVIYFIVMITLMFNDIKMLKTE